MAHWTQDLPVRAHYEQEDRAGELVDARQDQVRLAHDRTEDPRLLDHGDDEEGDADKETLVGDGQVDDVHVGDGLHLREADHHVYDEGVAEETDQTDEGEEDLLEDEGGRRRDHLALEGTVVCFWVHGHL